MFCVKCQNDLYDCTCPDIDERLAKLGGSKSYVVYRMCIICKKHYSRCKCVSPQWGLSNNGATQQSRTLDTGKWREENGADE